MKPKEKPAGPMNRQQRRALRSFVVRADKKRRAALLKKELRQTDQERLNASAELRAEEDARHAAHLAAVLATEG